MTRWRRFEVLFPLQFSDDNPVPPEWLAEAVLEVAEQFDGVSQETQIIQGHWRHAGVFYRDNLVRIVDMRDTPKNRRWMKQFKQRWKVRLKQLELWMVSYAIKVE